MFQLPASHVFMNTNYDYYLSLMLKNDEDSMETVINPLQDQTHVNICLELAAVYGELIQIGIDEVQSIALGNFVKSKSFYSLDLGALVSCDEATKRDIHEFISEGIRSGHVKPLAAKSGFGSFEQNSWQLNSDASYNVIALSNRQAAVSSKLNINPDSSYGIIGGEHYTGSGIRPAKSEYLPIGFSYGIETLHDQMVLKKLLVGFSLFRGVYPM